MSSPPPLADGRLVIFDCDGVLVDSERIVHTVLAHMLRELGIELSLSDTVDAFIGGSDARDLEVIRKLTGLAPPVEFMQRFKQETLRALQSVAPVPGVIQALDSITCEKCVASNGSHAKMRQTLGKTGLLPRFEGRMFSAEDVARPKPSPDLFIHACESMGFLPKDCVIIEDTVIGVSAARAAGIRVLGFAGLTPAFRLREAGADCVFQVMRDLGGLLATDQRCRPAS
jgi:HAD superfamily hydrolase (TIGR01509 family)